MTDDPLWQALQAAHSQATEGKGKERHGGNTPFIEQPIMAIQRMLEGSPVDGHLFQMMKKAQEAGRMAKRGDGEAAIRELYGVMVYAAAAAMRLEERAAAQERGLRDCVAARARQEAINRAGEKLRAGEFKPEDDNG